jgi:hypothetical protein
MRNTSTTARFVCSTKEREKKKGMTGIKNNKGKGAKQTLKIVGRLKLQIMITNKV